MSNVSIFHLTRRLMQSVDATFRAYAETLGLEVTPSQFVVMDAVERNPGGSQQILIEVTGIDRSTLSTIVTLLCRKKLLVRRRQREDNRAYAVVLTEMGSRTLLKARTCVREAEAELLSNLSAGERKLFVSTAQSLAQSKVNGSVQKGRRERGASATHA